MKEKNTQYLLNNFSTDGAPYSSASKSVHKYSDQET